ncbi:MAG: hypothetical protein KAS23_14690 [Anaerohalosphaera sp.]|nr:hypothetical protein [Anaerohalosphaera sp.]
MRDTFSTDYQRTGSLPWRIYAHRDYKLNFVPGPDPHKWFEGIEGPFEKVQSSIHANVFRCNATFNGKKYGLYFKQYFCRSFKDTIKNMVRPGRAMRGLIGSAILTANGLKAPQTIAVGEMRYGPFLVKEFAVTLEAAGARDVYWWLSQKTDQRSQFAEELGDTIGKMHKANICHGDLRPGNVMAMATGERFDFYFLDNERTLQFRPLPWKLRKKNLVQINMLLGDMISRTDRMRFFKSYMKHNERTVADWKRLAAEVAIRTGQRLEILLPLRV